MANNFLVTNVHGNDYDDMLMMMMENDNTLSKQQ